MGAEATLQGMNTVAWYFLWPTQSINAEKAGGCVREQNFFDLCQRVERVGIRSGWPHPSHLYRQLCGKLWIPQMSLNKEYRVPPTTRVHGADVRADARFAAEQAIHRLLGIRREIWGEKDIPVDDFKGVAKLGFSWQGDDVCPFSGVDNLMNVLLKLFEQRHSQQVLCLVQAMIPDVVCEHRIFNFLDAKRGEYVREHLWLKMKGRGEHHLHQSVCIVKDFALASAKVIPREQAVFDYFGGDNASCEQVVVTTEQLADRWLLWFTAESADPPPVMRLDFLVSRAIGFTPVVWTCEVGECGASLCSIECDNRNAAALNWAVRYDPSGRFPIPMPAVTLNNGWKS